MTPLRRSLVLVVVLAAAVALLAGLPGLAGPAGAKSRAKASLLFTLSGAGATMTPIAGTTDRYDLTVTDADPYVVWFTDRPQRRSGVEPLAVFSAQWDAGRPFASDPPNGAIVLHAAAGATDTVVVELLTLRADAAARTITAAVRVLGVEEAQQLSGNLAFHGSRHDPVNVPATLGAVSVFVDPEIGFTYGTTKNSLPATDPTLPNYYPILGSGRPGNGGNGGNG